MQEKIKQYLRRYTNHRELISCEIGSDGWITAKVITQKGEETEVLFRLTKAEKKMQLEYGIRKDNRTLVVDKKLF